MDFWTIIFITIISLTVVGIIGWLILLYKKNKLLTKSTYREIKFGLFSFINLVVLSMITTAIAVGLQMSYVNSKNTLETINIDHNITHTEIQKTGVTVNTARVMNFPEYSVNSTAADADHLLGSATWTTPELVGEEEIESFPEWVNNLIEGTTSGSTEQRNILEDNLILNIDGLDKIDVNTNETYGIWSDDNAFGMYIYILNMMNKYENKDADSELGFNFEFSLEVDWYKNKSDLEPSGTIKLVKKSDKGSTLNKSAQSTNEGAEEYYVNDVMYQNISNDVIRENDDIYLQGNQAIISNTFSRKNHIDNGDTIYFKDDLLGGKQELTMVGTGTMSSDLITQPNPRQPPKDPEEYTFAFIDDELFNNIIFTKLHHSLPSGWQTDSNIYIREYLVNTGLKIYERIGFATVYERINAGIVTYEEAFFGTDIINDRLMELAGNNIYLNTRWLLQNYASTTYNASGLTVNYGWEEAIDEVGEEPNKDNESHQSISSIFYPSSLEGDNTNWEVNRYANQYRNVDMQKIYSGPLTIIFVITNVLIIFMFTKRRLKENLPNIATLKALGHRTSKITASYTIYPILITVIGGLLGILNALWLQKVFMGSLLSSMALPLTGTYITIGTIFWNLILPILITTILITFVMYVLLKNNAFSAMQGESEGKPNLLVRGWSKIAPSNFMVNYRMKNTLRALGKSSFILISIFLSSTLLLLGSTFNNWQDQASEMTVQSWVGDAGAIQWTYNDEKMNHTFETVDEADQKIEDGTYQPYTFTDTPGASTEHAISMFLAGEFDEKDLTTWTNEIGSYLVETSMEGKYITSGIDLSAIWSGDIFIAEEFNAAIEQIGIGIRGLIEAPKKFLIELVGKVGEAMSSDGWLGAINKLFEILESWSVGEAHVAYSNDGEPKPGLDPSEPGNGIVITSSQNILTGLVRLISSITLLDLDEGYMPAFLHTVAIKTNYKKTFPDPPGNTDPKDLLNQKLKITYIDPLGTSKTEEFNITFNDVSKQLNSLFISDLVYSILDNFDTIKKIIKKEKIPTETEYEVTKILPGTKTFEEGKSFPLKFGLENFTTEWMHAGTQLNLIYDDETIHNITVDLYGENKTLEEKTDEYVENNVKNIENGKVYIPSTVSYMDKFSIPEKYEGNEIGSIKSTSLPSEWLDWSREKGSGNPDYTWIEYPVNKTQFSYTEIKKIFRKENGKFIVPVLYDENGNDTEFGVVSQVVGLFEAYVPVGDMYYANEGGLGDIINKDTYNIMAIIPDEDGNIKTTNKYQSYWSNEWDVNKPNKWTMLDQTNPTGVQPISTYGTGVEIPVSMSRIDSMVEDQYQDIATTTRLFTITSIIVIMWIIIILTKEVVEGTKKEASVLKAIGYGDFKTSSLIVDGNNIMMIVGVAISIPTTMLILGSINAMFVSIFNLPVNMVMSFGAMGLVAVIVAILILATYFLSYTAFRKVSPLEAIKRSQ